MARVRENARRGFVLSGGQAAEMAAQCRAELDDRRGY